MTIGAVAHCASPAKRITWNSQGPHGLPGAKGNTGSARAGGGAGTPGIGGGAIKGSNGGSTSVASASTLLLSDGGGLGGGDATNQNLAGAGGSPSVEAGVTTLSANAGANGNTATGFLNCPTNPDIPGSGGGIAGVAGSGAPAAWGCATPSPPEWRRRDLGLRRDPPGRLSGPPGLTTTEFPNTAQTPGRELGSAAR